MHEQEFAAGKDAQIEKEQRDNTELRKKCSALEKLCAELRGELRCTSIPKCRALTHLASHCNWQT